MSDVVVGSDGSIAVSATSDMSRPDSAESTLNLYASDGTAIRTLRLGAEAANRPFAYDGQIIALWQSGEIRVLNSSGRPIARFTPTPGGKPARDWPLAIAAQGRELWAFDRAGRTVERFELP